MWPVIPAGGDESKCEGVSYLVRNLFEFSMLLPRRDDIEMNTNNLEIHQHLRI